MVRGDARALARSIRGAGIVGIVVCALLKLVLVPTLQAEPSRGDAEVAPSPEEPNDAMDFPRHRVYELPGGDLSYWMRGDWEPPDAVLFSFSEGWSDSLAYLIASALDQAHVTLLVDPETTTRLELLRWFEAWNIPADEVHVVWVRQDSAWVRDYGPIQLMPAHGGHGDPIWLDAAYSPDRPYDDAVPSKLAPELGVEIEALPFPLEGGAIISNGRGLCGLTLEYCLEHGLDFEDALFKDTLLERIGCQIVALLPDLKDDRTRHADMFAQFLSPDVVAVARVEGEENAEDAARMDDAALGLQEAAARLGKPLRVIRVPISYFGGGEYLTYLNGLRLPESFIVPSYKSAPDEVEASAYKLFAEALPGVDLIAVPADKIIARSGAVHCISLGLTLPRAAGR